MKMIQQQLEQLNRISRSILDELCREEPSLETITEKLDQRESVLLKFRNTAKSSGKEDFSAEQQTTLAGLFDQFEELNHSIESKLHKALNNSRETLASATRQRKAEDGYNVLENPDISYFQ